MEIVAKKLLDIKAIMINNKERFTWASGIKSPIYADNRLITSYPEARDIIEAEFAKMVLREFPEAETYMGTATAGISHAAYISSINNKPMGYVRGSKKKHGRANQIEGHCPAGTKVVIIEDLISTGKSSLEVVDALEEAGVIVLGVASIFTHNLPVMKERFSNVKHVSLTNLDVTLKVAAERGDISKNDISMIKEFRDGLGK